MARHVQLGRPHGLGLWEKCPDSQTYDLVKGKVMNIDKHWDLGMPCFWTDPLVSGCFRGAIVPSVPSAGRLFKFTQGLHMPTSSVEEPINNFSKYQVRQCYPLVN